MPDQVVVSFRMSYAGVQPGRVPGYLARARALTKRAEALGATLASWSAVTLSFAWDPDGIEEAISLATSTREDGGEEADAWACGIAQGSMEPLAPQGQRADLAWGPALVQAVSLARVAHPGEVLVDASVGALHAGDLLILGSRIAVDAGRRVRGARLDVRQPWKQASAARVAEMVEPTFCGRGSTVASLLASPGTVSVLRADPGLGGSRVLSELRAAVAPAGCIQIAPSGLAAEPLGALRRSLLRNPPDLPVVLQGSYDRLVSGEGVTLDVAAGLVSAALSGPSEGPPAIVIDDATDVDGVTLEACARAASRSLRPVLVVARLDAMLRLPEPLAALPRGVEVELKPLGPKDAEGLASQATGGALVPEACKRWARRGGYAPLAILEAIACSLATGELAWIGPVAAARRRAGGKGKARPASYWLVRRAEELPPEGRAVLSALAFLGGEAKKETLARVLSAFGAPVRAEEQIPLLMASRWLRETAPDWVGLMTRSHREAVIELVHDARVRAWHRAVAQTLEQTEGALGRAEAAYHAGKAGDGPWAARLALAAARAASESHLEGSAMRLFAFAHAEDPACEAEARREVAMTAMQATIETTRDSEPPTLAIPPASSPSRPPTPSKPPSILPPGVAPLIHASSVGEGFRGVERGEPPEDVASRLAELAKQALLSGDAGALEKWCDGLKATGEHDLFADRLRAMAYLSHGQIANAIVALRRARAELEQARAPAPARCQASLALGVAQAHAGRTDSALLHGLDALARAREAKDPEGERACKTFLAKLFGGMGRS